MNSMAPLRPKRFTCGVASAAAWGPLLLASWVGCGHDTTRPTATLAGRVQLAGQPLPEDANGYIQFHPVEAGQASPAGTRLEAGQYRLDNVPMGRVRVLLSLTRLTGRLTVEPSAPNGTPFPESENLVPNEFRQGIELTVAGDNLQQNFDL